MNKLKLELDTLEVQSFATGDDATPVFGTVHAHKTGLQDTNCSAVDRCASARGCTQIGSCDPALCAVLYARPSANDACPSSRGCTEINC